MKKAFEKALKSKQAQRARNASRPIAEKFRTLDRLREGTDQLKRGKLIKSGKR
jgi:hypothetical protein